MLLRSVFLLTSLSLLPAQAATWIGGEGNWEDAGKWAPSDVPDSSVEAADIGSGSTAIVSTSITVGSVTLLDTIVLNAGATLVNEGLFNAGGNSSAQIRGSAMGTGVLVNEGIFRKAGAGWVGVSAAFTNAGRVEVSGGNTDFSGIFTGETGSEFDVASGAVATFQYGEVRGTVVTTGAGVVRIAGTTTNQGSLTFNGASNWAGTLTGSGTTYVGSAGTMSISDQFSTANLSGHTLVNDGVVNIGATGPNQFYTSRLDLGNGATLVNKGQFNLVGSSSSQISASGLGSNVFRNEGTFSKAGTSWAGISAAFTNAGRVEVSGGYTDFNGIFTGEVGSEFDVASAAAASFQYGEVRGTVVTTGAGMVRLTGTTTNQGSLTVNGASNWAGTLTGSGTTYVGSAGTMSINDQFSTANLSGHTLVNNGVVNIGATAPNQFYTSRLDLGNGATLVNQGQFNIGGTSSAEIRAFGTGSNVFVNEGTFSKVGTSAAFVSAAFTNAGTVEVNGGILTFAGSFISESGSVVRVAEDRVAVVDGIVSGVISDPGAGGNLPQLTKDGAGSLTLTNANTYEGGTLVEEGSLFANNGTNGSATGAGTVTVTGTGTLLGGTGTITGPVHVGLNSRITGGTAGDAIANPITAENVGHLTVGALTLSESSIFHVDIFSGSSFDGIAASTISMQGAFLTLNIASDATFTDGGSMILLTSLGRTGVFSGITQGMTVVTVNGFDLKADYTAGGFALNTVTAVPEPSTWMGAGMLLGLASWCLRKRKSSRFANA